MLYAVRLSVCHYSEVLTFCSCSRRVLAKMDMIQVGRHYFNKNTPIKIPQHK